MATSNFVVSEPKQTKKFADAIEKSYQESLRSAPAPNLKITHLKGSEEVRKFMARRKENNAE